jgi:hypothetical protein
MAMNLALDEIFEVKKKTRVIVEPTKITTVSYAPGDIFVGSKKCSGKNQLIVGSYYNSTTTESFLTTVSVEKRGGLDLAIKSLGLEGKVKCFQVGSSVYLKKI